MAKDPSFDIVSQVELNEVDNAISQALKEINNRFDLKDSKTTIERSDKDITIHSSDDFSLKQVLDILELRLTKREVPLKAFAYGKVESSLGGRVKQVITARVGIDQDQAKKITKLIKDSKLKVSAQIQGDTVRITGKKRDDLQAVMQLIREAEFDFNTQFVNYRG
ncbi:MAG: YajQ family cyclic di-GMP-binding protein [Tissierellia bacterium]|jgi:uncharacterized protein YajQ (UPF0234 family)|nr:YajQ family cyclic di-GMP-binding protein [Tissierellia bacterium]